MLQLSTSVRNGRLDSLESVIGASPILRIRTGVQPANCAASRSGTVLATIQLPADWMQNAAGGAKAMVGTWEDQAADAAGTAGHFEFISSDGTVCHMQGSVTLTGGGGDMIVDNVVFAAGQKFTITAFTLTEDNA